MRWGPHGGAHRVALRAGVSVCVPLLVLVLAGRVGWAPYAAFGAFTSLYGRRHARAERAGMQVVAGAFLVLAVTAGALVSLASPRVHENPRVASVVGPATFLLVMRG